jgi:hypothetical protein
MNSLRDTDALLKKIYRVGARKGLPTTITPEEVEAEE